MWTQAQQRAAPTPAAPPCSIPYTFDARGVKHYKPECLNVGSTPTSADGKLTLVCVPTCEAVLDGATAIGWSPILGRPVAAGTHTLVLTTQSGGRRTLTFVAKAGETTALRIQMP